MGYTNYWSLSGDWSENEWKLIRSNYEGLKSVLGDAIDETDRSQEGQTPFANGENCIDEVISFNGAGDRAAEVFQIYQRGFSFPYAGGAGAVADEYKEKNGVTFAFCKTDARNKYDSCVWAMLEFMHDLNPYKIEISNDDGEQRGMWRLDAGAVAGGL